MTADIKPQHLLLKAEQQFFLILPDIGHRNLKLLLILFRNNVKQRHLPRCHTAFAVYHTVENLPIETHVEDSAKAIVGGMIMDKKIKKRLIKKELVC